MDDEVLWSDDYDITSRPMRLRSAERGDVITPRSTTKFGDRAIAVSGSLAWNSLPTSVQNSSLLSYFVYLLCLEL